MVEFRDFESTKITFPLQTVRFKLKKLEKIAFRSELLELCKTGTKKSSPVMFNNNVILTGHDMVIEDGRATTCRGKGKTSGLHGKSTETIGPTEKKGCNRKTV